MPKRGCSAKKPYSVYPELNVAPTVSASEEDAGSDMLPYPWPLFPALDTISVPGYRSSTEPGTDRMSESSDR